MTVSNPPFGAQLLKLPEIFNGRFFNIPDYQRGYAWERAQVEDLLKDIDHLMLDKGELLHYTGTLVLSRPAENAANDYHVIDGQQRLTTLSILLRMVGEKLPAATQTTFNALYLQRGGVGNERTVLQLGKTTQPFFARVVLGDGNDASCPATLEVHKRLLEARQTIGQWVDGHMQQGTAVDTLHATLAKRLGFLVYAPLEDAETGIMFEVINNRGKPLSELEKVKNFLIYCSVKLGAGTLRHNINTDWADILNDLNAAQKTTIDDESSFLRYCVTVFFSATKSDSKTGYEVLKDRIAIDSALQKDAAKQKAIETIRALVTFLKQAAMWYRRFYGRSHIGLSKDLIAIFEKIRAQNIHASIMPLFLALVIRPDSDDPLRLVKLLRLLEVLNFRVYMARRMSNRSDSGQGKLYYIATQYFHCNLLADVAADYRKVGRTTISDDKMALEYLLVQFTFDRGNDAGFIDSLTLDESDDGDFFNWYGLRYFLINYEESLQPKKTIQIGQILVPRSAGKSMDYLSVEHLWATKNRNGEGENDRPQDDFQKRRLGNFVLLELRTNIQGSNADLEEKIPKYLHGDEEGGDPTNLAHVRRMAKVAKDEMEELDQITMRRAKNYYCDLHRNLNDKLEERYREFAAKRWSLEPFLGYRQMLKAEEAQE